MYAFFYIIRCTPQPIGFNIHMRSFLPPGPLQENDLFMNMKKLYTFIAFLCAIYWSVYKDSSAGVRYSYAFIAFSTLNWIILHHSSNNISARCLRSSSWSHDKLCMSQWLLDVSGAAVRAMIILYLTCVWICWLFRVGRSAVSVSTLWVCRHLFLV